MVDGLFDRHSLLTFRFPFDEASPMSLVALTSYSPAIPRLTLAMVRQSWPLGSVWTYKGNDHRFA